MDWQRQIHTDEAIRDNFFEPPLILNTGSGTMELMAYDSADDAKLEDASKEVARAIWQTVLLARDEHKARGLLGKATRKRLVQRILELMRVVQKRNT